MSDQHPRRNHRVGRQRVEPRAQPLQRLFLQRELVLRDLRAVPLLCGPHLSGPQQAVDRGRVHQLVPHVEAHLAGIGGRARLDELAGQGEVEVHRALRVSRDLHALPGAHQEHGAVERRRHVAVGRGGRRQRAVLPVGAPGGAERVAIEGGREGEEVEAEERGEVGGGAERRVDDVGVVGMRDRRGEGRRGEGRLWRAEEGPRNDEEARE